MKYKPVDLQDVKTYPLAERKNKVRVDEHFCARLDLSGSVGDLLQAMPRQLAARSLNEIIDAIVAARKRDKPVIMAIGGHVIKCGLQPILKQLIEARIITALAMNGAGAIHDYEISLIGETSEDVGAALHCGTFGMAEETGRDINAALAQGVAEGVGFGEAVARFIVAQNNPFKEFSLLAACLDNDIPVTVHAAIGTDIIHQHPLADGRVLGEATFTDFRLFTAVVSDLGDGGVYLNVGSAVVMPEVFLKALSIAHNLGCKVEHFTTADFDMQQHYRPRENVVRRPVSGKGRGYSITGHHEIMIPLLAAGILGKMNS